MHLYRIDVSNKCPFISISMEQALTESILVLVDDSFTFTFCVFFCIMTESIWKVVIAFIAFKQQLIYVFITGSERSCVYQGLENLVLNCQMVCFIAAILPYFVFWLVWIVKIQTIVEIHYEHKTIQHLVL